MNDPNPYGAPLSNLEARPEPSTDTGFLVEPRKRPFDAGMDWLRGGWQMFQLAPGTWIALLFVWFLLYGAVSLVPFVGGFAAYLAMTLMMGGIAMGCDELRRGGTLEVAHLFAGYNSDARNPLLLLGVMYLVAVIVVVLIMMVPMFLVIGIAAATGGQDQNADPMVMVPLLVVLGLVMMAVLIPLGMAMWFAPPLVALNGMAPIDAMKSSFRACWLNFGAVFYFGVIAMVLTLLAMLPLLLGLLVVSPMLMAANYAAYRDIYYED